MTTTLCIYQNEKLLYSTTKTNPLLFNVVRGFNEIASRNYGDSVRTVSIDPFVISVMADGEYTLFSVDNSVKDLQIVYLEFLKMTTGISEKDFSRLESLLNN